MPEIEVVEGRPRSGPPSKMPTREDQHHQSTQGTDTTRGSSEGEQLKLDGQQTALHAAHPAWNLHLEACLDALISFGREFTAEDLRALSGDPIASSPNTFGAVIGAAARAGRIVAVGYRPALRPAAAGRILRVWRPK